MVTQTFNDDVLIDGSADETQLVVQGHSTQNEPLQEWQDESGNTLAQVSGDGRIQSGDMSLSTPDALIEAHRDDTSTLPERGIHTLGRIASAITNAIAWAVFELELIGSGAISSLHSAVRARLTHSSTGDSSSAEVRAGDFETVNQSGSSSTPLGVAVGVQGTVDNQANAYLTRASAVVGQVQNASGADIETAVAFEVAPPVNDGTIDTLVGVDVPDIEQGTDNYAIRTGKGVIYLGDVLELPQQIADPADKADVVQFYTKDNKVFAKAPDPDNTVYDLTQGLGGGAGTIEANAGEAVTARQVGYLNPSDNKIYLVDSDANPLAMATVRGFVTASAAVDSASGLQIGGVLEGFTGLTPGLPVFASATAGGYTQTRPVPILNGDQIAILQLGIAVSATTIAIDIKPVSYQKRVHLLKDETVTVVHHNDSDGVMRKIRADQMTLLLGTALVEHADSNQDSEIALRDKNITAYSSDQTTGGTASASSEYPGIVASRAFDDNIYVEWAATSPTDEWIEYDFGTSKTIRRYIMTTLPGYPGRMPKDFRLQYYDGSAWQDADVRTGITDWGTNPTQTFDVATTHSASRWRIYADNNNDNVRVVIGEIEMLEATTFGNGADKLAQTFLIDDTVRGVSIPLRKQGDPTGILTLCVETLSSGDPSGTLVDANLTTTLSESLLSTAMTEVTLLFPDNVTIPNGTYALVISTDRSPDEQNYVLWGADSSGGYGDGSAKEESASAWSDISDTDFIFAVKGLDTEYRSQIKIEGWDVSGAELVNRKDDGAGSDADTKTTFKAHTDLADVTCIVDMD
ncbi:MAG: discoidin domain-containing protein [Chloroflexota bacterium]